MYSGADLHKGGVSPFGHPRINDRSHLPAAFRSVPRPSSPLGAKASTERPSFTQLLPPPARRTNTTQNLRPRSNQHPRVQPDGSNTENNSTQPQITTNTTSTPESMPAHQQPPGLLNTPFRFTCQRSRETNHRGLPRQQPVSRRRRSTGRSEKPRSTTRPQPLARRVRLGDGRYRTDDPLLAKQALSH